MPRHSRVQDPRSVNWCDGLVGSRFLPGTEEEESPYLSHYSGLGFTPSFTGTLFNRSGGVETDL